MKKADGIRMLKSRLTWLVVASAFGAVGITVQPEQLAGVVQAVITIMEHVK